MALTNGFFDNNQAGLDIKGSSSVSLSSVEANDNQQAGATIATQGFVSITNGFFNGNQAYTSSCKGKSFQGYGLQVVTTGFVSVNNVTADDNYVFGAHLEGTDVAVLSVLSAAMELIHYQIISVKGWRSRALLARFPSMR